MVNKQIRDTVFRDYFNNPQRLLSLGNAILNTNYNDPKEIVINTLEGNFYSNLKNDISFLLGNHWLILVEHQTTINFNMPLRFLFYITELLKNHVATMKDRLYSTELIKLPTPEFYVFYDGTDTSFDHQVLRLSDAFEVSNSRLDLEVHCYNLNDGKSQQIKQRCQFIYDYSRFSNAFKSYRNQGQPIDNAIRLAVEYCKEHNVMTDYLPLKESEVLDMFGFEWNEEDLKKAMQHEAERREARGKIETTITTIKNLMKNMNWSAEAAMAAMGIAKADYSKYLAML